MPWHGKRFTHYWPFVQGIHSSLLDFSGKFPIQKASGVELWIFISCQPDYAVSQAVEMPVTWDGDTSSKCVNSHGKMTLKCPEIIQTQHQNGHYKRCCNPHYGDVITGAIASQITSLTIVYSTVYSDAYQRKHESLASLAFVWGIHRSPVNSPHKWPVTRNMFPFDDVIMVSCCHVFFIKIDALFYIFVLKWAFVVS